MKLEELLKSLKRDPRIAEFVLLDRTSRHTARRNEALAFRSERSISVRVFADNRSGRGEAVLELSGTESRKSVREAVERTSKRAAANTGPAWRLPPPSAPARVLIEDARIFESPEAVCTEVMDQLRRISGMRRASAWCASEGTRCVTSGGFDNSYRSTRLGISAVFGVGRGAPVSFERIVRTMRDFEELKPPQLLPDEPRATPGGDYDLVVTAQAYGRSPNDSIFAPLVQLAEAESYRRGLARVREGQRVTAESVSLSCDGTIDYGLESRPFDDDGCATRKFSIIEKGKLAGLALDARSAAMLGRHPNGGVSNLVMSMQQSPGRELETPENRPLLVLEEPSWVQSDPNTGSLSFGISRARIVSSSGTTRVQGGIARCDAMKLFASPVGSNERIRLPWLVGPASMRLGTVSVA